MPKPESPPPDRSHYLAAGTGEHRVPYDAIPYGVIPYGVIPYDAIPCDVAFRSAHWCARVL